jgi:transposase
VNIDYHIELDGHYYSVPHRFVGNQVDLRITANTVEILLRQQRVAIHPISSRKGHHSTLDEHMPALHRAHRDWTPAKLIGWGERIGAATGALIAWQMEHRKHPEQGYRSCLGLLRLARTYGDARLDAACARATAIGSPYYRSVNAILAKGLDQQPLPATPSTTAMPVHENVRGPDYYH